MIRNITLQAFKRFENTTLALRPLTLLTGFNSGGKSSVLQALLLCRNVFRRQQLSTDPTVTLPINGEGLSLGSFGDVINEDSEPSQFVLKLDTDKATFGWRFTAIDEQALTVSCTRLESVSSVATHREAQAIAQLRYVPASRLSPQETYPLVDPARQETGGDFAEWTYGNLWHAREEKLRIDALRHPSEDIARFAHQVRAWMETMFPDIAITATPVTNANLLTIGIRMTPDSGERRPNNVGFGVTSVLPIVISILLANHGDIVLIENPEIHLHPRAQVQLARLCAKAAAAGVQVVLESHSDHILNGIRVAVHSKIMQPRDVSILFFDAPQLSTETSVTNITVSSDGRLSDWPSGFFDEEERLLDQLLQPNG